MRGMSKTANTTATKRRKQSTPATRSKTTVTKQASSKKHIMVEEFHPNLVTFLTAVVAGLLITLMAVFFGWL